MIIWKCYRYKSYQAKAADSTDIQARIARIKFSIDFIFLYLTCVGSLMHYLTQS